MSKRNQLLESKISAALSNPNAGSEYLAALIEETEHAATQAEATVDQVRARSLDIMQGDVEVDLIAVSELTRDRLHTVLPRLRDKAKAAAKREIEERWFVRASRLQEQIDASAENFRSVYPAAVTSLLSLFTAIRELEAEVSMHNAQAPSGAQTLRGAELTARGMPAFSTAEPSVTAATTLIDPSNSAVLWPPQRSSAASVPIPVIEGLGVDWHLTLEQRAEEERRQWGRVISDHQQRAAEQAEKVKKEDKERIEADRGVRQLQPVPGAGRP